MSTDQPHGPPDDATQPVSTGHSWQRTGPSQTSPSGSTLGNAPTSPGGAPPGREPAPPQGGAWAQPASAVQPTHGQPLQAQQPMPPWMAMQPGGPSAYVPQPRPRGASAGAKVGSLALSLVAGALLVAFMGVSYRQLTAQVMRYDLTGLLPYYLLTAAVTLSMGVAAFACGRMSGLGPILGSVVVGVTAIVGLGLLYAGEYAWLVPDARELRQAFSMSVSATSDGTLLLLGAVVLGGGIASAVAGRRAAALGTRSLPLAALSFVLVIGAFIAAYVASARLARLLATGIPRTARALLDLVPWGSWAVLAGVLVVVLVAFIMAGHDPRGLVVAGFLLSAGAWLLVVRPQTAITLLPQSISYGGISGHIMLALCAWLVFAFGIGIWWRRAAKR